MREIRVQSAGVRLKVGSPVQGQESYPAVAAVARGIEGQRGPVGQWRSLLAIDRPALWFLLGVAVFVYLEVFILPAIPVLIANDQSINLDNAVRMIHGQGIYKDFFQYTLPGTELFYFALFKIFGIRAWIPNASLIGVAVVSAWLGMFLARRVLRDWHAYVPILLFIYAFHFTLDATHHKYSVLFVLAATAALIDNRSLARVACAGLLMGLAACFTQSRGVVAAGAFAVFVAWEGWLRNIGVAGVARRVATLLGVFAAVVIGVSAVSDVSSAQL